MDEQIAEKVRLRLGYMRWVGLLFRWYIADQDGVSQDVALTKRAALRRARGREVRQFQTGGSVAEPLSVPDECPTCGDHVVEDDGFWFCLNAKCDWTLRGDHNDGKVGG